MLRNHIKELPEACDVVVVGSGYGAGACAARLAQTGARVVMLERGREFIPGNFPNKLHELFAETQYDRGPGAGGHPTGLFDFRVSPDLNVLIGCGLGGTSLINANVSIEPDERLWTSEAWPEEIRREQQNGHLGRYFGRARDVLKPVPYPERRKQPPKLEHLAQAAGGVAGARFHRAEVNVDFDRCTGCGDCVTGCNHGAKRTVYVTYLPLAKQAGAQIFAECSVKWIEPNWTVHFEHAGKAHQLKARAVILGAGALGSPEVLLRSARHGLNVSKQVGRRFSGNGDAIAFGYNCDQKMDSVGWGTGRARGRTVGPTITGIVDMRDDARPWQEGIIIEEGAFPSGLAKALRPVLQLAAGVVGEETQHGFGHWMRERWDEFLDLFVGSARGALNRTELYLMMGHDGADGRLELDDEDKIRVKWPELRTRAVFTRSDAATRALTSRLGGMHVKDPLWTDALGKDLITVHPLGGCAMGKDADAGAVDHAGRVFRGSGGVWEGLYVADGAVLPTSLGVNPLLTITALAERVAEHAARDLGLAR